MKRAREFVLNGLLAVLVLLSLVLSSFIWFPPDQWRNTHPSEPRLNPTPISGEGSMPDIFRPERIYVRTKENQVAMFGAGSEDYRHVWNDVRWFLSSIHMGGLPPLLTDAEPHATGSITLVLPVALELREWADYWGWSVSGLLNPRTSVDQVTLYVGETPWMSLTGPTGWEYRVGPLPEKDAKQLQEVIGKVAPELFVKSRPLTLPKDTTLQVLPGVLVPDVSTMKLAEVSFRKPDQNAEEARYFPDLSVVRKIDERDAQSFTDGQRLLKLNKNGILEFWSVPAPGAPPELNRAMGAAKEFVDAHGGWPQDLVLSRYRQQPGKGTTLIFELRKAGPFPVESVDGAAWVEVVTGDRNDPGTDRISRFRRFPDITSIKFSGPAISIISPEQALKNAQKSLPQIMQDFIREIHLAYLISATSQDLEQAWSLEPVWVIEVGENPVYVSALINSTKMPLMPQF